MRSAFFHRYWQGRLHQFATRAGLKSGLTILFLLCLNQLATAQGTFSPTGSMTEPRVYHTLTLLPNGKVLATGSRIFSNGTESATAELYDPATGTWSRTGSMATTRHRHTATLLKNGKVLVAGGSGGGRVLESAELYDPVTGTWSPTGSLLVGTDGHTAKLLQNGKVLVAGGGVPRAAQLYDPETGLWSPTGSMVQSRFTAGGDFGVVLNDGRVLVAGGIGAVSSEIYNPASGTWSATGSLTYPGGEWTAMNVLADGRVLISGGRAELYDPATGVWTPTPPPPRSLQYSAMLLLDGTVFMAGGIPGQTPDDSLLYNPVLQTWTSLPGNSPEGNRAVRLLDGRVLVAGGVWSGTETTTAAFLFTGGATLSTFGHQPAGVAVNPFTNRIYVANEEGASVDVVDGVSNNVATTINVGRKPRYVAVDPVANRIYVTRYFCRCVSVIDGATNLPIADIPVGGNPLSVAVNPATRRVYVATVKDSTQGGTFDGLVVFDAVSNMVLDAVTVGSTPVGVAVNPNTNRVYVTNAGSNTISVVDGVTGQVLATIPMDDVSDGIGVNPDTGRVYVPNPYANTVAVIDGTPGSPTLHTVIASVAVGNSPTSVAIDRGDNRIYVANSYDRTVSVIDGATNGVVSTVAVGGTRGIIAAGGGLDVNTSTHRVYVSHQQEDFVSFFDAAVLPPPGPPAPLPPSNGTISGRVLDPSGNGVAGAGFQVCPSALKGGCALSGTTDTSGAYVAPLLSPGTYDITASPPQTRLDLQQGVLLRVQFIGGALTGQDVRLPARPTTGGAISGRVTNASNNPLAGARVQACLSANGEICALSAMTDTAGNYRITAVPPGTYDVEAFPPAGSTLIPGQLAGPVVVVAGAELTGRDFLLVTSNPPPPSTGITAKGVGAGGVPSVQWGFGTQPTLFTTGCSGGTATFTIDQTQNPFIRLAEGVMMEVPSSSGKYTASVTWNTSFLNPGFGYQSGVQYGPALVKIRIRCPNGTLTNVDFQIYVDPSGVVKTPEGTPIVGASVTLFRSDTGSPDSFDLVPDGDVVMSPSNRRNPDTTGSGGRFGWDVLTGFYIVRAEKAGCYAPSDPSQPFVESPVLTIPPAVLDLDLQLAGPGCPDDGCPNDPNKTEPGVCGCGVADVDSDGDGVLDCLDSCPSDPAKIVPGVCGCGIPDTDSDGDGTPDCTDQCPIDPTRTAPSAEVCNGADDNCNGQTDEGFNLGATCTVGVGACQRTGVQVCTADSLGTQCNVTPGTPGIEVCGNNIDEDCDGADLACPPPPPVDTCTPTTVLDNFNRADGSIGNNWRGVTGTSFYRLAGNRLDVQAGGPIYWNPTAFGPNQAAFVTLSTVAPNSPSQGVLLKVQSSNVPNAGAIAVVYDAAAKAVRVSTFRLGAPVWTPYGNTAVMFTNGDKLGACAKATGEVRVYKNDTLVKTVTLTAADQGFFNAKGGKVGVWSVLAPQAFLDDFGGATVAP